MAMPPDDAKTISIAVPVKGDAISAYGAEHGYELSLSNADCHLTPNGIMPDAIWGKIHASMGRSVTYLTVLQWPKRFAVYLSGRCAVDVILTPERKRARLHNAVRTTGTVKNVREKRHVIDRQACGYRSRFDLRVRAGRPCGCTTAQPQGFDRFHRYNYRSNCD
jgi:hypothetical protein